jgi:hypothetical protein
MSDLFEVRNKTESGAEWRGEIDVVIDEDHHELTVRQLLDPEFWEVMSLIDTDELAALESALPEDKMEEYDELQESDDLSGEDRERLEELQAEIEESDINLFDTLSKETYEGLLTAAKYGVEPDAEDVRYALANFTNDIDDMYGGTANDDAEQYVNEQIIAPMIDRSTDFTSFAIGIKVVGATLDDEGN